MKATGVVRRVDMLGRIVLPIELRRGLGIDLQDPIEIFVKSDEIILRKYLTSCMFCKSEENLTEFKGKIICTKCANDLTKKFS